MDDGSFRQRLYPAKTGTSAHLKACQKAATRGLR
jgi:hypothetical protein